MDNRIVCFLLFVLTFTFQSPGFADEYDLFYNKAREAEGRNDFNTAKNLYNKAISFNSKRIEARYSLAKVLSWDKNTRIKALTIYKQLVSQFPHNKALLKDYAEGLYWQGNYDESIKILEKLIKEDPANVNLLGLLADVYLANNKLDLSLDLSNNIYSLNPKNLDNVKRLANINFWKANYNDASKWYEKIISGNKKDKDVILNYISCLLYLKDFYEADKQLDNNKSSIDELNYNKLKAKIYHYNQNDTEAVSYYQKAYELNPEDKDIITEYCDTLEALKEFDKAEQILKQLQNKEPDSIESLKLLAARQFRKQDFSNLIATYQKILAKDTNNREVLTNLILTYLYNKEYDKALESLENNKANISEKDYYSILAKSNFYSNKNLNAAYEAYQKAINLNPGDEKLKTEYVDLLLGLSKWKEADEILTDTLNKNKQDKNILLKLAQVNLYQKNYAKAQELLNLLISIDPDSQTAYFYRGELDFYQGNLKDSLEYYKKAYELPGGQNAEVMKRIADIYSWTGEYTQATKMYELLKEKFPDLREDAMVGEANTAVYSGSLFKARKKFEKVLEINPDNLDALLGIAHIHNDLNQMLKAEKVLKPVIIQDNRVSEELARSYTLLGRKDKAVKILGKDYLSENKNRNYFMREIYWANRSNFVPVFNFFRESGDLNNQIRNETYGGSLNIYPRGNLKLGGAITFNPYRTLYGIAKATSRDYFMDIEYQATDRFNVKGNLGIIDFSNDGIELNGGYALKYRVNDNLILRNSYQRSKVEESFLSVAGLTPVTGYYNNMMVGQVTDNNFKFSSTILAPYHKIDFTSEYFLGYKKGLNIPSNFYQGFFTNAGLLLLARDTYSPVNVIRLSNSTYFVSYENNLSGFGGTNLYYSPLGSDQGNIYPMPQYNAPGTGGYFSPGYMVSSVMGLDITGYIKKLRLRYNAGFSAGIQNVKHNHTEFVYEPRIRFKFNEFGHVGFDVGYAFNNYGQYNKHNLAAFLIFRF